VIWSYRRNHRSPIAARLRNKVRVFRTKGEGTRLWASRTCPIYVEFSFFSIALAAEMSTIVSLNCPVSTAQGAQPDIFQRARLACVFQIGRRSAHRWGSRGRDHVELSFVEITKDSRTVWIRTLREHQASRLGSYCLRKQSETNLFDGGIDRCPRKTRHGLSHTLPSVGRLHLPFYGFE
jgi:hypothetical protein